MVPDWPILLGSALSGVSASYAALAAWLGRRPQNGPRSIAVQQPVSVLKPLCGSEPRLYENLATLCRQDYPQYQIVFGVRDADDPAIAVIRRLRADFPACDIALTISPDVHGSNLKVSNLINLLPQASHDWLVIADSDIAVTPDYLRRVTAPLAEPGTGVVTCLYRGRAVGGFWAHLGAQFIDDWFAPSVRIAHAGGSRSFAFGATIALRRDTLAAIGGFTSLSGRLADDYWLGELTRRQGLTTVLSDVMVSTDVTEASLRALWSHEVRWLRTIRSLKPVGFAFTFITFTWPILLLSLAFAPLPAVLAVALAGILARCLLAGSFGAALRAPLRDALLLAEWAVALCGSRVRWREQVLSVRDLAQAASVPTPEIGVSDPVGQDTVSSHPPSHSARGAMPQRTL
ncbi:bacteriohopanetetrol glucosamine biosynthesis glycosyltransferase HpnI [Crenobacter sp. SG2305]|uniref:bacteriohopanetetrol glucosamine biosynthesis glycosyltransferase HpnI n=1 Tax=Crenobacter oryzisoli TaxID=3056844 RepID=UPI0025AB4559|nr:bacteriohopanetetrol glucosamine biosynthesis glycosyltransferase HpnI [Crenobacter sp. SG2305]MDN0084206.1 bacteriohopanetetrol glucosamine biosynthesis glycosyltransferase HpnI [Crenobacter sp. SG2305]